ncbi:DUF1579 family protein [Kitasatospora sp. NPDC005856]|uniref:DUF1579 family protein n=1 Tax=Kitasatospora sp. NPDC005856 TaxID=3154566 RepID=UPI0033F6203F
MTENETLTVPGADELPAAVRNGLPSAGHRRLDALVGVYDVEKFTYFLGGTPDNPIFSRLRCDIRWLDETGGRFLNVEDSGLLLGQPYFRRGTLGYATMDDRYEWITIDNVTTAEMQFKGLPGSGSADEIWMSGEFTDPGVLNPDSLGKRVGIRTLIKLEAPGRHVIEMHFTPPNEPERLADRMICTRRD